MHDFKIGDRLYWFDVMYDDYVTLQISTDILGICSGVLESITRDGMIKIRDRELESDHPHYYYKSKNEAIDAMISYLNQLKD